MDVYPQFESAASIGFLKKYTEIKDLEIEGDWVHLMYPQNCWIIGRQNGTKFICSNAERVSSTYFLQSVCLMLVKLILGIRVRCLTCAYIGS